MNAVTEAFAVTTSKGTNLQHASRQWASRPDDQRFLSVADLLANVEARHVNKLETVADLSDVRVIANPQDADRLTLDYGAGEVSPTNWAFGQLCQRVGAPASYLRGLPATLAAINMQYGVSRADESAKLYARKDTGELLAATSESYGRVYDVDVVRALAELVEESDGRWKVPGVLDWSSMHYNPYVNPTKDSTTLYASDRDVWAFLVDDTRPIQIGTLPNGDPDLVFRGLIAWNSEVGSKTLGLTGFFLRAVCQNRNIWGAEDIAEITIRHTVNAPRRFFKEVRPALLNYANASETNLVRMVQEAKRQEVAHDTPGALKFLRELGFAKAPAEAIAKRGEMEEGHEPRSVWDFVQSITAYARSIPHTDDRVSVEQTAGKLLRKVAVTA